jgi:hypothetical protein
VKTDQFPKLISFSLLGVIILVAVLGWKLRRSMQDNQDLQDAKATEVAKVQVEKERAQTAENQLKTKEELLQTAKDELQRLRKASTGRRGGSVAENPQGVPGGPNSPRDPIILRLGQLAPWEGYLVDHPYFAKSVACLQFEDVEDPNTLAGCISARETSERKLARARSGLGFWRTVGVGFGTLVIGTVTYELVTPGKQIFK